MELADADGSADIDLNIDVADELLEEDSTLTIVEPIEVKRQRCSRIIEILEQRPGQEGSLEGKIRSETLGQKEPGLFTAGAYHYLYYAPAPQGDRKIVPTDQIAQPGECHAVLDPAANLDADSVTHSNTTYEFAGIDPAQPELLYTRTFTCACSACRMPLSADVPPTAFRQCPYLSQTGRWRQNTVHSFVGISKVAVEQRVDTQAFAKTMEDEHLYACFGAHIERGGRPYWLLHSKSLPYPAPRGLKTSDGSTIRKGTCIVDAHWYTCTSDSQDRRTYHREESELVHVLVKSLVQEADLH
jgi:hypothetical protein